MSGSVSQPVDARPRHPPPSTATHHLSALPPRAQEDLPHVHTLLRPDVLVNEPGLAYVGAGINSTDQSLGHSCIQSSGYFKVGSVSGMCQGSTKAHPFTPPHLPQALAQYLGMDDTQQMAVHKAASILKWVLVPASSRKDGVVSRLCSPPLCPSLALSALQGNDYEGSKTPELPLSSFLRRRRAAPPRSVLSGARRPPQWCPTGYGDARRPAPHGRCIPGHSSEERPGYDHTCVQHGEVGFFPLGDRRGGHRHHRRRSGPGNEAHLGVVHHKTR